MRITHDRDFSEYPVGSKAFDINGGHWERVQRGWKWLNGDTFGTPGASHTNTIELPDTHARCTTCRKISEVKQMITCMDAKQMHRYVCDSKCMIEFYK